MFGSVPLLALVIIIFVGARYAVQKIRAKQRGMAVPKVSLLEKLLLVAAALVIIIGLLFVFAFRDFQY